MKNKLKKSKNWWDLNDAWVLITLYFIALPVGKTLWLPLIVMSITGTYLLIRDIRKGGLVNGSNKIFLIASCFLIPAVLSLPDSLVPSRTLGYIATYPLFISVCYFILCRIKTNLNLDKLIYSLTLVTLFWAFCSFWQFILPEYSPFSPPVGGRYQGVFSGYWVLGYVLAAVIPFMAFGLWSIGKRSLSVVITMVLIGTCLISGNRASWVSIIFMLVALPIVALVGGYRIRLKYSIIILFFLTTIIVTGSFIVKGTSVEDRLGKTLAFFKNPSISSFEYSSSGRGEIWATAIKIGNENSINGTGVDNFRFAYPYYAPEDSPYRSPNPDISSPHKFTGAMYPHQIILQQYAGAGWPGLIGIILFYVMLVQISWRSAKSRNLLGTGAALAVWMGFFPLNTHLNFHGGWLTANFWVWVGLMLCFSEKPQKHKCVIENKYSSPKPVTDN